jgi:Cys-tRNA(Pro)/Cys-tRNA(Cys) deacylase
VDLKKAAKASGNKKAEMIHVKELLPLTGYIRGGCTAIGMKKPFPVFLQQDVAAFDIFYVSAGQRGLQLKLSPKDYISYTGATLCDIAADEPQPEQ